MISYNGFTDAQRKHGQKIINKAIAEGKIKDPMQEVCVLCGQDEGIREWHNEDYTPENLLKDAKCLCWHCHRALHRRFENPERFAKYIIDVVIYGKRKPPVYINYKKKKQDTPAE